MRVEQKEKDSREEKCSYLKTISLTEIARKRQCVKVWPKGWVLLDYIG